MSLTQTYILEYDQSTQLQIVNFFLQDIQVS